LAVPAAGDIDLLDIPGKVKVAEEVPVLLVPAAGNGHRAGIDQAIGPTPSLAGIVGVGLEIPDARDVELVTHVVL
jgi:hypothetical protein